MRFLLLILVAIFEGCAALDSSQPQPSVDEVAKFIKAQPGDVKFASRCIYAHVIGTTPASRYDKCIYAHTAREMHMIQIEPDGTWGGRSTTEFSVMRSVSLLGDSHDRQVQIDGFGIRAISIVRADGKTIDGDETQKVFEQLKEKRVPVVKSRIGFVRLVAPSK